MSPLWTSTASSLFALLTALFAVVLWKLIRRRAFSALFQSPRTLFAVAATLIVAIVYAVLVVLNHNSLPNVPKTLLTLPAVSNGIYLAPRIGFLFSSPGKNLDPERPA